MIKKILGFSVALAALIVVLIEPTFDFVNKGNFFNFEESLLEPIFWFNSFIIGTTLFLLFFNQTIQTRWWRWARWVMLVSLPVIFTGSTSGYAWLRRTDLALICGLVLLGSTVIYALLHRFYFKVK